ncbi:MAG: patatin family protein [Oscillospiraceae bacterium]|nr:patatin family protein [Oscillospiraceae bacterium]
MKTGLILEGGAMRGMFTAGVMDVMMENGVEFDGAIGVSAGAAFGCNYKTRQIGRVIRYNTRFSRDKRYCGVRCLLRTGDMYSADFAYGEVPLIHDPFDFDTYMNNPMEFYVVCTDIEKGEAVYHRYEGWDDHGFDWIRASASMPLVSRAVEIDGMKLLDGGISDSVPLRYFESIGYDRNIVVLTRPSDYVKKKNGILPLIKAKYRKYPKMVELMADRHNAYNKDIAYITEKEKRGEVLVIRPEAALPIGRVDKDPEKLRAVYEIGRQTAEKLLPEIKRFLGSDGA